MGMQCQRGKAEASGAVFEGSLVVIFLVGRAMNEPTRQKEVTNPPDRNDQPVRQKRRAHGEKSPTPQTEVTKPSDRSDQPTRQKRPAPRLTETTKPSDRIDQPIRQKRSSHQTGTSNPPDRSDQPADRNDHPRGATWSPPSRFLEFL